MVKEAEADAISGLAWDVANSSILRPTMSACCRPKNAQAAGFASR
jgi:hypothetical protein